jgi:hypothetical protein
VATAPAPPQPVTTPVDTSDVAPTPPVAAPVATAAVPVVDAPPVLSTT